MSGMDANETGSEASISRKLYQYLCDEVAGSENVVKYRRLYYTVYDDIHSCETLTHISSGSRAEGLCLPGSDLDIMYCIEPIPVIDSKCTDLTNDLKNISFTMESDNTQPGFVHLSLPPNCRLEIPVCEETVYGHLLSNRKFKNFLRKKLNKNGSEFFNIIHGPCLSTDNEELDLAVCFRCNRWPHDAMHWLFRERFSRWPPREIIHKIASHGILVVPIGSKSTGKDNPLEWRISFSEPEKMLIYTFNHTQFLCYALLKLALKQIINKQEGVKNILCSYYMKTVLFWISEEFDVNVWKPSNLLHCFWNCVQRILYWVYHCYIPNYFIPEHNMIGGKIDEQNKIKLVRIIERLKYMGWKSLTNCESLRLFLKCVVPKTSSHSLDFYEAIKSTIFDEFISHGPEGIMAMIQVNNCDKKQVKLCLERTFCKTQLKVTKRLYSYYFTAYTLRIGIMYDKMTCNKGLQSNGKMDNRLAFKLYQRIMHLLLIGTNRDAVTGWIMLAILFYGTGLYFKSIEVLNYLANFFSHDKIYNAKSTNTRERKWNIEGFCFFRRLRTEVVPPTIVLFKHKELPSFCFPEDLTLSTTTGHAVIVGPPAVLTYYLRFLCYLHLNHYSECHRSQQDLKRVIQEEHFDNDQPHISRTAPYIFLKRASEVVGDKETAFESLCKVRNCI